METTEHSEVTQVTPTQQVVIPDAQTPAESHAQQGEHPLVALAQSARSAADARDIVYRLASTMPKGWDRERKLSVEERKELMAALKRDKAAYAKLKTRVLRALAESGLVGEAKTTLSASVSRVGVVTVRESHSTRYSEAFAPARA